MTLAEEQTERILAYLRRETSPVPTLFNDITEMYKVNLPVFMLDNKTLDVDGKIVTLDGTILSDPIAICLNTECKRCSSRGFKLSEFNSKLLLHLHEITHIVYRDEIINHLREESKRLEDENISRETLLDFLLDFRNLVHWGIEKRITKIAHLEYKKLRPYICKDKYEWKSSKKPDIEIVKYDFFSV